MCCSGLRPASTPETPKAPGVLDRVSLQCLQRLPQSFPELSSIIGVPTPRVLLVLVSEHGFEHNFRYSAERSSCFRIGRHNKKCYLMPIPTRTPSLVAGTFGLCALPTGKVARCNFEDSQKLQTRQSNLKRKRTRQYFGRNGMVHKSSRG